MVLIDFPMRTAGSSSATVFGGVRSRRHSRPGEARSMLAREIDRAIREPERDRVEREVSVGNLFRENHDVIPVLADQRPGSVRANGQFPYLELLRGQAAIVRLDKRDLVEQ